MDRRSFLRLLATGGSATVALVAAGVDLDQLGWTPGRKTFIDAPPGGWTSVHDTKTGISIRLVKQYDVTEDRFPSRMDTVLVSSPFQVGDIITIAGRYAENPKTYERKSLQAFVVTEVAEPTVTLAIHQAPPSKGVRRIPWDVNHLLQPKHRRG